MEGRVEKEKCGICSQGGHEEIHCPTAHYDRWCAQQLAAEEIVHEEILTVNVKSALGIIVVTSVLHMHPSVDLIVATVATHLKQEPLLAECHEKIIVADRPKVDAKGNNRYKSGRVASEDDVRRYEEYLARLEEMIGRQEWPFAGFRLYRMPVFGGFGMSLKAGLEMLRAPYALVLQHDRILKRPFDVQDVLISMMRRPGLIRYVGLASNSSVNSIPRYRTMHIPVQTHVVESFGRRTLVPIPFWYDSSHIANVKFYLDFVFGWHVMPGTKQYDKPFRLKTGDFPEDKLGNAMLAYLRVHGMKMHKLFGCYLLDDGVTVYCRHVHGRKINTGFQRQLEHYVSAGETCEKTMDETSDSDSESN